MSMETTMIRKRMPVSALLDPKIVVPAIGSAFVKLDPRTSDQEPGHVRGRDRRGADHDHLRARTDHGRRASRLHVPDHRVAVDHRAVRQLLRGHRRGPRQGAGRFAAAPAHRDAGQAADRLGPQELQARPRHRPQGRRCRPGRGRRHHPVRRRGDRRHRLGQRGGDHRRIGAGHPRVRAATARRSPAARRCCPTGSACASPRRRARPSSTA